MRASEGCIVQRIANIVAQGAVQKTSGEQVCSADSAFWRGAGFSRGQPHWLDSIVNDRKLFLRLAGARSHPVLAPQAVAAPPACYRCAPRLSARPSVPLPFLLAVTRSNGMLAGGSRSLTAACLGALLSA